MSRFLEEFYSDRKLLKKQEYDPRDNLGPRLGMDWQPHDTILSVTWKRFSKPLIKALDPDRYTWAGLQAQVSSILSKEDIVVNTFIILTMPASIIVPYLIPRLQRAKREYYFHQYLKRHFLGKQFGMGKKIPLRELKRMLQ
jgi:hypothetical protein